MTHVDARGDACPLPVVKAKRAISELKGAGQVEILVDNEIAVQNLTKMDTAEAPGHPERQSPAAPGLRSAAAHPKPPSAADAPVLPVQAPTRPCGRG